LVCSASMRFMLPEVHASQALYINNNAMGYHMSELVATIVSSNHFFRTCFYCTYHFLHTMLTMLLCFSNRFLMYSTISPTWKPSV
jgi:uncharacterized membrane protein